MWFNDFLGQTTWQQKLSLSCLSRISVVRCYRERIPLPAYLKRQCFAKSFVSSAVHSPFGLSFSSWHHSSLPTLAEQAESWVRTSDRNRNFFIGFSNFKQLNYPGRVVILQRTTVLLMFGIILFLTCQGSFIRSWWSMFFIFWMFDMPR